MHGKVVAIYSSSVDYVILMDTDTQRKLIDTKVISWWS